MTDYSEAKIFRCKDCGIRFCPDDGDCGCVKQEGVVLQISIKKEDVISLINTIDEILSTDDIIIDSLEMSQIKNLADLQTALTEEL